MGSSATKSQTSMSRPQVIEALRYEISRPPAMAGQRLINERQLAQLMGANRMTIRRSLDDLEKQGLVIRRQGSGTYIRKIPGLSPCPKNYMPIDGPICVVDESDDQPTRLQPDPVKQQLTIGLWGDMHCTSAPANKLILSGIKQRLVDLNHCLQTFDLEYAQDGTTPVEHIVDELSQKPCDGYIVTSHMVSRFLDAYQQVFHRDSPPLVQVWPGSVLPTYEPLIQSDTQQAIERGTLTLAEQGHKRIMLVEFDKVRNIPSRSWLGYELAMQAVGLPVIPSLKLQCIDALRDEWKDSIAMLLDMNPLPDALCMASEEPLQLLYDMMKQRGIKVGRDMAILTIANVGVDLPAGENWSTMVFDPRLVGGMAVTSLVDVIVTAGQRLCSFSHQAHWQPGKTHLRCAD
ncbi:MAG TPA: hypothetical protein DER01_08065 [Phycisphaerales bacterium]|nr:hypothetical protein [Phycisphaerales bacterium]|tara:strand:- start:97674 stop:98882 length:1209 start_codon:yes stop_codon:yes gene_type:complete